MSKTIIFAFVVMMAAVVLSVPAHKQLEEPETYQELEPLTLEVEAGGLPVRVTCDLLSGIGWGHTFCAAHCLLLGYKGGYCNDRGICICRR